MRIVTGGFSLFAILFLACSCFAAGGVVPGPNEIAPDRYVYYPGTEVLAEDEVRVSTPRMICLTSMPRSMELRIRTGGQQSRGISRISSH